MTTGNRTLPMIERLGRSDVIALGSEWDALVSASPVSTPFLSWPWIGAWLETLGLEADLEVVVARDPIDGRLIGIAPFFVETRRRLGVGFRSLRLIGSGPAAPDHLDMPIAAPDPAPVAAALWQAVNRSRRWDFVDLDGVASGGWLAGILLRRRSDRAIAEQIPAPFLPLEGGWDAVQRRFGSNHRQNLGRYRRKLDRDAAEPLTERIVVHPTDLEATMDRLIAMHQTIRTSHGDPGAFATPALEDFQRAAARRMLAAGRLRLWRLDVGSTTIAAIECFRFGDTVSFYTTGFDPSWAAYGPGRAVMARAIRGAVDEGAAEFDFLRGDESYKRSWGTATRHDLRIRRPATAKGRLLWSASRIVRGIRGGRRPRT